MALGWFLSAWRADQLDWARQIVQKMPEGSAERTGMAFLLDTTCSAEKLFAEVPAEDLALAYFLVGERHLKAGAVVQAIEALERSSAEPGSGWLSSAVEARLTQLRAGRSNMDASDVRP